MIYGAIIKATRNTQEQEGPMARTGGREAPKRNPSEQPPPKLLGNRVEAGQRIDGQLNEGRRLLDLEIDTPDQLSEAQDSLSRWSRYNHELLTRTFDSPSYAREYSYVGSMSIPMNPTFQQRIAQHKEWYSERINRLESIRERLELIPEAAVAEHRAGPDPALLVGRDVFVAHGTDLGAKDTVARFLESLDLQPIVLQEKANEGKTVIEKFEEHSNVVFAVVLLTPDDVGAPAEKAAELRRRARQNAIFELGYFCGSLSRRRVCALLKGELEIPSNYSGVLYIPMDGDGAWQWRLAREMKSAGIEVDLNKAM